MKRAGLIKSVCALSIWIIFLSACASKLIIEDNTAWAEITLHATGFGQIKKNWSISDRMQAIQSAKVDAYTKLASDIMKLQVNSKVKVAELVENDAALRKKINAFVRGAQIIRTTNNETGVMIVTELFLGGDFKATIGLGNKPSSPPSNLNGRAGASR